MPRHIVKGDTVIVTSGSAKGSVGEVIRVLPDEDRVVVSGVNAVSYTHLTLPTSFEG